MGVEKEEPTVVQITVTYYAVYPGGRRCEVSLESLEKNRHTWLLGEGVFVETDVVSKVVPVYGKTNLVTSSSA